MSNVVNLPQPPAAEVINDETMSLLTNDQLAWRIWSSLNETEGLIEEEGIPEWKFNQNDVLCEVSVALICARVLVRRMTGMEPKAIAEEHHRLFMIAAGLPVDGGAS